MNNKKTHHASDYMYRLGLIIGFVLLFSPTAIGQEKATDGATPLGLAPGAPAGSYALSGFESVNLYNGNLNFHLPLVQVGGRGSAGYALTMRIDRKWLVKKEFGPPNRYEPTAAWWDLDLGEPILSAGMLVGRYGMSRDYYIPGSPCTGYVHNKTLTRLTFTTPDGTEYELRDQATNGEPHHPTTANCSPNDGWGLNRGKIFVTADGSSATFVSNDDIKDYIYDEPADLAPSGYLVLRDGTRYEITGGRVMIMRDRNGNKVTFGYTSGVLTSVTDALNRQLTISYNADPNYIQIAFKGFGGSTTRYIKIYRGSSMRSDYSARTYQNLFNYTLNNASDQLYYPSGTTAVELPNGQQYQFQYNDYGELARVIMPTGGAIEYDYAPGLSDSSNGGVVSFTAEKHVYRRVVERRVYPSGGSGSSYASRTTYSRPESSSGHSDIVSERQYDASSNLLGRTDHYFNGSPRDSLYKDPTAYGSWKDGREYRTIAYHTDDSTLMRQVDYTFEQRAAVSWWSGSADSAPPNDPRLVTTVTTLADTNQVTKTTSINPSDSSDKGFDQYNNQTDVWEYEYGSGAPGSLLRHTHTSYITSSSYTTVNNGPGLLSLPSQVSVYNASGVERARSTYEYDVYSGTSHHSLIGRTSISGLCDGTSNNCPTGADFTSTSYTTRGNATATTNYLLNTSGTVTGSITAYAQYDVAGNVVKAIDARGYETSFAFDDHFGIPNGEVSSNSSSAELGSLQSFAFATSVTNAKSQTSYAQYDFYTGRVVDAQDANGIISSGYSDNDPLDRPTKIIKDVNGGILVKSQTLFTYDDTNRIVTATSDFDTFEDQTPLKTQVLYDGLGRTIEKRQYEGGSNYIAVQTQYDALGRPYKTSNPFRPWQSESAVWTTTAFDALGRATTVTTSDSAVVTTAYSGNRVLVADQNGRKRISVTDGLGRLKEVWEVTASDSATESVTFPNYSSVSYGYVSRYDYDTLDNLITVSQRVGTGGTLQERTFVYDTLKRLTSATNPESGTISYQYDDNGNLLVKTDARSVSAHYQYDELNRVVRRWYNGSSSTSSTTNNSPSLPSGVATSDEVSYLYDSQSLPSGAPSYTRGYSVGRLVAVTYGGGSTGDYYGYDAAGRMSLKIQRTGSANYQITPAYNVGGAMLTQTYPSGHTVTNSFDDAGRLQSLTGTIGDGFFRTYATGISYASVGGMQQEQFGTTTAVYNRMVYNNRGQLTDILTGTGSSGAAAFNRGKIVNDYGTTDNNGNLKQQTVYVPNSDTNNSPTSWYQQYGYDSLNRLTQVYEYTGNTSIDWQQKFVYDRFGNRTVDQSTSETFGAGIPKPYFSVNASNNRLTVPSGQSGTMTYDDAGNLTVDTYSAEAVSRTYDAENRMKQETQASSYVAGTYTYDGDGRRVKRVADGAESWQVYGIGGELIAEYAASGDAPYPRKEYGYRNGQLLITAESGISLGVAPEGLEETAATSTSITLNWGTTTGATNYRIERKERNSSFAYLNHTSSASWSDTVSSGSAYLYRVCTADGSNNCTSSYSNVALGVAVAFTDDPLYGLSEVPDPASATTIKAAHINELRAAVNAVRYLAVVDDATYSHPNPTPQVSLIYVDDVRELRTKLNEALTVLHLDTPPFTDPTLVGLSETSNPANATPVKAIHIRELRERLKGTLGSSCYKSTDQFVKDFYQGVLQRQPSASELTSASGTLSSAQASSASALITAAQNLGASLFNSSEYASLSTSNAQFVTDNYWGFLQRAPDTSGYNYWLGLLNGGYTRANMITAFQTSSEFTENAKALCRNSSGGSITGSIRWMVTDQLGTPRIILDSSGSLANVSRHDYLPFGEEVFAGTGVRTSALNYSNTDATRQKFTSKERDDETGLDYFGARYHSPSQGRFTSPDEFTGGPDELYTFVDDASANPLFYASLGDPRSLNKYQYAYNNPLRYVDPDGHSPDGEVEVIKWGATIEIAPVPLPIKIGAAVVIAGAVVYHYREPIKNAAKKVYEWASTGNTEADAGCPACGSSQRMGEALMERSSKSDQAGAQKETDEREGKDFTPAGKRELDARSGGKCENCGRDVRGVQNKKGEHTPADQRQRHHKKPRSEGGGGTVNNGEVLCPACHKERHRELREQRKMRERGTD